MITQNAIIMRILTTSSSNTRNLISLRKHVVEVIRVKRIKLFTDYSHDNLADKTSDLLIPN